MEPRTEIKTTGGSGAFPGPDGICHWRVWAPHARHVDLVLLDGQGRRQTLPMQMGERGVFTASASGIREGQRYLFALNGKRELPDPASRWQPEGVHAPSAVWDPGQFLWTDSEWRGIPREQMVIYELHVGTFTAEGTFAAIIPRLKSLRELGITAIELLPVAQFPGRRNWGYDGTYWYAVQNSYGGPRELQRLVDACHAEGLAVILDVVYNHLGPEGNYLAEFGPYFTDRYRTPWGRAVNYDDSGCDEVREFVLHNVRQWFRDFHFDGLRLDAAQAIYDLGPRHMLAELQQTAETELSRFGRTPYIVAESDFNNVRLMLPPSVGGYGLDAQWNDDFHHSLHALITGERSGYYADFHAPAEQLVKAWNSAFVFDGIFSSFRGRRHGAPAEGLPGHHFVACIQNHDQVGNRARGDRLSKIVNPSQLRLAAAILLLSPQTPMLFMGEEYGETNPFPFFCDFGDPHLREAVRKGRLAEFSEFRWSGEIPDAQEERTFGSARLSWSWSEDSSRAGLRKLYRDLLALRRKYPPSNREARSEARLVSQGNGLCIQVSRSDSESQSLVLEAWFNCSAETVEIPTAPTDAAQLLLSSEELQYGGCVNPCAFRTHLAPYECLIFQPSSRSP